MNGVLNDKQIKKTNEQQTHMPKLVIAVCPKAVSLGSFFTAARDPQAKDPTAKIPERRPIPNFASKMSGPIVKIPPNKTNTKPSKNQLVSRRLSKSNSNMTPATGMSVAAMAAINADVKNWVASNNKDPSPNPKKPTHKPFNQSAEKILSEPSKKTQRQKINITARLLRTAAKDKKPQFDKSASAAGKLKAKRNMDRTQVRFNFIVLKSILKLT